MPLKTILIVLLTALLSYVALLFLPWWSNLAVAFLVVLALPVRPGRAFMAAAAGVGLCWAILSVIADIGNGHILSAKMAALFRLSQYWIMIAVTVLTGFITGGLGGWAAGVLRAKPKTRTD